MSNIFPIMFRKKLSVKGFERRSSKMVWCDRAGVVLNPVATVRDMHIYEMQHCEYLIQVTKDRCRIFSVINKNDKTVDLDLFMDKHIDDLPTPSEAGYCYEALMMSLS